MHGTCIYASDSFGKGGGQNGKVPPQEGFVGRVGGMGFPAPLLFAWLAAFAEFAGGILIAIGLLTRPISLLVFLHFVVVVFVAHAGDSLVDRLRDSVSTESADARLRQGAPTQA